MSAFSDDSTDPEELSKYAPKGSREQPATPNAERLRQVSSASTVPSSEEENQNRSISPLWPRPVPEPPAEREHGLLAWVGQAALVAAVSAVVALLVLFAKPLLVSHFGFADQASRQPIGPAYSKRRTSK